MLDQTHSCCIIAPDLKTINSSLSDLEKALHEIIPKMVNEGFTTFYNGLCPGIDLIAAETILTSRVLSFHQDVKVNLILVLPPHLHDLSWAEGWLKRFALVLSNCSEIVTTNTIHSDKKLQEHEYYMIDKSQRIIILYNNNMSNIVNDTLNYAQKNAKEILLFPLPDS